MPEPGNEKDSPAPYSSDAALPTDHERLVASRAFEHVHADARPGVVVEPGVARLPPQVEPGLGVRCPPEELEGALSRALERVELDQSGRGLCERGALVRGQVVIRVLERVEAAEVQHD